MAQTTQRYSFVDLAQLKSEASVIPSAQQLPARTTLGAKALQARVELLREDEKQGRREEETRSRVETAELFSGRAPSKRWKPDYQSQEQSGPVMTVSSASAYAHSRSSPVKAPAVPGFVVPVHNISSAGGRDSVAMHQTTSQLPSRPNPQAARAGGNGSYLLKEPMDVFSRHLVSTASASASPDASASTPGDDVPSGKTVPSASARNTARSASSRGALGDPAAPIGDASLTFGSRPWSPTRNTGGNGQPEDDEDDAESDSNPERAAMRLFERYKREQLQRLMAEEQQAQQLQQELDLNSSPYRAGAAYGYGSPSQQPAALFHSAAALIGAEPGTRTASSPSSPQPTGGHSEPHSSAAGRKLTDSLVPPAYSASSAYQAAAQHDSAEAMSYAAASQFSRLQIEPAENQLAYLLAGLSTCISPAAVVPLIPPPRPFGASSLSQPDSIDDIDRRAGPTTAISSGSSSSTSPSKLRQSAALVPPGEASAAGSPATTGTGSASVLRADAVRLPAPSGPCFSSNLWDAYRSSDSLLLTAGLGNSLEAMQRAAGR